MKASARPRLPRIGELVISTQATIIAHKGEQFTVTKVKDNGHVVALSVQGWSVTLSPHHYELDKHSGNH